VRCGGYHGPGCGINRGGMAPLRLSKNALVKARAPWSWHSCTMGTQAEGGPSEDKSALRRQMRERRAMLSAKDRGHGASAVAEVFEAWVPSLRARVEARRVAIGADTAGALQVLSFVGVRGEINTAPLHQVLLRAGARLWLPRIEGVGAIAGYEVTDLRTLRDGPHGLREPAPSGPRIARGSLTALDLVLAPGVAFARDGVRLGQGGGYYDRLLGDATGAVCPLCIGVGFAVQLVDGGVLPSVAHDVRLDGVLTPAGVVVTSTRLRRGP